MGTQIILESVTLESIEELKERWEIVKWIYGIDKVLITEQLKNNRQKKYIVNGLSMEIENEFAMCEDYDDMIISQDSSLMMFLKTSLKHIILLPVGNGLYIERLVFEGDDVVFIEQAN